MFLLPTIGKKLTATYNGISVQDTWEKQVEYILNEKIGKYHHHYFARYEDGKIVEVWRLTAKQVYDKLLPNQKKQIIQAAKAFQKSDFEKEVRAKLAEPKTAPKSVGSAVENKRKIGMNKGGLKMPSADQVGLKKLPTQVRNKMGYMYGGGMTKKPKMGNMDYRKGGMVMIVLDMMKKKKGRK